MTASAIRRLTGVVTVLAVMSLFAPSSRASTRNVTASQYAGLSWRFVGPLRGGRTTMIAGVPDQPNLFYITPANGGVWKTDDAGRTWTPLFDQEPTGSVGAIAIAPSDDNIIYVGSGEGMHRPDLSVGDGMYKSTDAGRDWSHLGLRDAQQIAAIAVDPRDPRRLFVSALGHPYGPNAERGVYRSTDGGATFQRVLYKDDRTGSADVVLDPGDPQIVYASLWMAQEAPWEASFDGPGSGVFRSADGGSTWTRLTSGLPRRIGRAVIAVAPSDSHVVYVMAGTPTGCGFYQSADAGTHFVLMNDHSNISSRCFDLSSIAVDPNDAQTVWITSTSTYRSQNGGKTFVAVKGAPGGDDYTHVWINPKNANMIALSADQGATISQNAGRTWSSWYNQPTGQMFHVNADNRFPYWICGGQQDSGSACVSSRGDWGEITERDWHPAGAEEYGYVVPDPLHPGVFFGGKVERFDEHTDQSQDVSPMPLRGNGYRVVRTEPLVFDPLDRQALYFGANRVFVTRDAGMHWTAVSPDLTRMHPALPSSIGPFESQDKEHGAHRGVVYALAVSPVHEGTIWAGTDDGLMWITRDRGVHWQNITPLSLTPWSKIAQIDASPFDDETAYVAVTRFRLDDLRPYIYITHDGGRHWRLASNGLPREPVNAVRGDPQVRDLLYAATENGVEVSFDDGWRWQSLQQNMPHSSARDVIVHGDDLVVATHGRGFWILDDVEPLRELTRAGRLDSVHLFAPEVAVRMRRDTATDTPLPPEEPAGTNPPDGAIIDYYLPSPASSVKIAILDRDGSIVRSYSSDDEASAIPELDKPAYWIRPFARPATDAGMHRFVWDLHETAPHFDQPDLPIAAVPRDTPFRPQGALAEPGRYVVRLAVDGQIRKAPLLLAMDPRVPINTAQLAQQYSIAHAIVTAIDRTTLAMHAARQARESTMASRLNSLATKFNQLLPIVDGVDAPVTAAAQAAFCDLMDQASKLGIVGGADSFAPCARK